MLVCVNVCMLVTCVCVCVRERGKKLLCLCLLFSSQQISSELHFLSNPVS